MCLDFLYNVSLCKKNRVRYHKCKYIFMLRTRYSCQILITLDFSIQIFERFSNIKLHENPPRGSRVVPCNSVKALKIYDAYKNEILTFIIRRTWL
jgi:hypothetical protein